MFPVIVRSPQSTEERPLLEVQSPENRRPLATGLTIRQALDWFLEHCRWLPRANAKEIARKLVLRAIRYGTSLEPS